MRNDSVKETKVNLEGVINYVNQDRGFGFIAHATYPEGLFFHAKDVKGEEFDTLQKGTMVAFTKVIETKKGMTASGISIQARSSTPSVEQ